MQLGRNLALPISKGMMSIPGLILLAPDMLVHVLSRERTCFSSASSVHTDTVHLMLTHPYHFNWIQHRMGGPPEGKLLHFLYLSLCD